MNSNIFLPVYEIRRSKLVFRKIKPCDACQDIRPFGPAFITFPCQGKQSDDFYLNGAID